LPTGTPYPRATDNFALRTGQRKLAPAGECLRFGATLTTPRSD
jgi:hypothetical protein